MKCARNSLCVGAIALALFAAFDPIRPLYALPGHVTVGAGSAHAEAALAQLRQGNYDSAAHETRLALQADPGDSAMYALAGALLLTTDQPKPAQTAFENALKCNPADSLALYGMSLSQLAQGDRRAATDYLDRSENAGGDRSYVLIIRRYLQWLDGAQVEVESAGLPEPFIPVQQAMAGMAALHRGDRDTAQTELEAAQKALPGDGVREAPGLLLTFDPTRPLSGSGSLHTVEELAAPLPRQPGLHGVVEFSPQDPAPEVSYVSYELDGQSLTLINVRPYSYAVDTTRVANGQHSLTIVLYDAHGQEISRATQPIQIFNMSRAGTRVSELRTAIWQALTPLPSRFACTQSLGRIRYTEHDTAGARIWFERAAAVRPDDEIWRQVAACGGLATPGEALWGGRPDEKVVALTFDDGPKPGITEPLLDVLTQTRTPATFFVIGRHVAEFPELTRRIAQAGMEIANHSFTHPNLTRLSAEDVAREVMQTQVAVIAATGVTPRYLRPPGGNWNASVANVVRAWGLTPCMWTVDAYGSEVIGAQETANAVLQQVQPGSIILMHNGKLSTLQALPTIIRELRARGYSFATVSALAERLSMARDEARRTAHDPNLHRERTE